MALSALVPMGKSGPWWMFRVRLGHGGRQVSPLVVRAGINGPTERGLGRMHVCVHVYTLV